MTISNVQQALISMYPMGRQSKISKTGPSRQLYQKDLTTSEMINFLKLCCCKRDKETEFKYLKGDKMLVTEAHQVE